MNPQPTQDATDCARWLIQNNPAWESLDPLELARELDRRFNLPALTVVAMAAQVVADGANPERPTFDYCIVPLDAVVTLRDALAALPKPTNP